MCETITTRSTLRQVTHPVLDRILLERDELERLQHVCRALVIFEELETVLRDAEKIDRPARIETLLNDLDDMRSQLPAIASSEVRSKCLMNAEA